MREFSVPERLGAFGVVAAAGAVALPPVQRFTGFGLPCPLRTLTGVPCPLCGMTTAAQRLAAGEFGAALAASPLALGVVGLVGTGLVILVLRATGRLGPPTPWSAASRIRTGWVAGVLATASWLFQLHRFDII
jgi:hypothetical protein